MRRDSIRRIIVYASPDDGSDYTSFDTVKFTMFFYFRICYLVSLVE